MTNIRRTAYVFFYLEDDYVLDVASLLRAESPRTAPQGQIIALAILTGERHPLDPRAFDLLLSVPAEHWVDEGGRNQRMVADLSGKGLLLSDEDEPRLMALRERDEALSANAWNLYAALYHYMTQWSGVDTSQGADDDEQVAQLDRAAIEAVVAQHGPPPGAFADTRPVRTLSLPGEDREGALFRVLTARRTTRAFDTERPMTLAQLDTVLRYVFGCHGYGRLALDALCIKRTSPSAGALHPIEIYPIVTNVLGVSSGIYHYGVRDHSLALLQELEPSEARRTATSFMCGQSYFGAAHVSFILTARFYRHHWKYRTHHKAYAAILMDAAHLTQTLYLVSSESGLGAFVTLATNGRDIEEFLGFESASEGVISMAGCGLPARIKSPLEPDFSPQPPP
jgi:putative peptide maturation dehydrogenase